jgi:phosphomannomutase
MNFDKDDIALGKRLAKQYSTNHDALGELANRIEKKYGDGTLEEFAEAIGIAYSTLKNCRHVHRKWKNSPVKPKTFSVAKALASYKDKDEYIATHPSATEKEARTYVRAYRQAAKDKKEREMLDAERKGSNLGNWTKATQKLIKRYARNTFR